MYGVIDGDYSVYSAIERSLSVEALTFSQLQNEHQRDFADLAQIMSFLCHSGRVGFSRDMIKGNSLSEFEVATDHLTNMQLEGYDYNIKPAFYTGSAVSFSLSEAIMEKAMRSGRKADLISDLANGLEERGYSLANEDSNVVDKYLARRASLLRQGVLIEPKQM
jgi:hypothetical protein